MSCTNGKINIKQRVTLNDSFSYTLRKKSQWYKFHFLIFNKHEFLNSVGITGMLLDTTAPHTLSNDKLVEVSQTQNNRRHETKAGSSI
jgi:hypothetical protein